MSRKLSAKVDRAEYDRVVRENGLYARLLHLQANGRKPSAVRRARESDGPGKYRYELWDATGAIGGILVTVFSYPGQNDSVTVQAFDASRPYDTAPDWHRAAWYELLQARDELYRERGRVL